VKVWVPARLKELKITPELFKGHNEELGNTYFSMFDIDIEKYTAELIKDTRVLRLSDPKFFNDHKQEMIVEGAQGLMLDEFLGQFPHVTRSVTGLSSSIAAAFECGYTTVQPVYVTRSYLTRHGNGPLSNDGEVISNHKLNDLTNVENKWQGAIRYAPLNLDELKRFIELDYIRGQASAHVTGTTLAAPIIFLTCMDQLSKYVQVQIKGTLEIIPSHMLPSLISTHLKLKVPFISYGPSAADVQLNQV
jgi:adenylosuccinate synthase